MINLISSNCFKAVGRSSFGVLMARFEILKEMKNDQTHEILVFHV